MSIFAYRIISYIKINNHLPDLPVYTGKIENWTQLLRGSAYLIITKDGKEYHTNSIFSDRDAPDYVGCTVSYVIYNETLFILELLKNKGEKTAEKKSEERPPFLERLIKIAAPEFEIKKGAARGLNSLTEMDDSEKQLDEVDKAFLRFVDEFNSTLDDEDTDL